jgi:hypothetical protein
MFAVETRLIFAPLWATATEQLVHGRAQVRGYCLKGAPPRMRASMLAARCKMNITLNRLYVRYNACAASSLHKSTFVS